MLGQVALRLLHVTLLWTLAATLGHAPAAAQAAQAARAAHESEARAEFEQGRAAYDRGAFAEALAHFERAHARSPRAELLYNIGRAADSDGQNGRAAAAYSAFLEAYPNAQNRDFVRARLEKVRALEREREAHGAPVAAPPAAPPTAAPPALTEPAPVSLPTVAQSTPVAPEPVAAATPAQPRADDPRPVWKKGWFWTAAGVVVAGTVTAVVLATRSDPPEHAKGTRVSTLESR